MPKARHRKKHKQKLKARKNRIEAYKNRYAKYQQEVYEKYD